MLKNSSFKLCKDEFQIFKIQTAKQFPGIFVPCHTQNHKMQLDERNSVKSHIWYWGVSNELFMCSSFLSAKCQWNKKIYNFTFIYKSWLSWAINKRYVFFKCIVIPHECLFSVLFHPVYPETQMVSSHSSSSRTEVTRIKNVCIDDAHGTATQKSRMDQQMTTALHGMPNSVTKQARDMCTYIFCSYSQLWLTVSVLIWSSCCCVSMCAVNWFGSR